VGSRAHDIPGDWSIFVSSPTAVIILILAAVAFTFPGLVKISHRAKTAVSKKEVVHQ
jgi:hypothetical protein